MNIHRKKINKFYEYNDSDLLKQFNSLKDQQELMIPKGQQEADLDTLLKQGLRTYPALTTHLTPVVCHDFSYSCPLTLGISNLRGKWVYLAHHFRGFQSARAVNSTWKSITAPGGGTGLCNWKPNTETGPEAGPGHTASRTGPLGKISVS